MAKIKTKNSKILTILLSIAIIILLAIIFLNNLTKTPQQSISCQKSGNLSKENYLPVYMVQKGDTILSVASKELNDTSRVNEIISLNKENFPDLSISKPFLEVGWKLLLPPTNTTKTNGLIYVVGGNISTSNKGWGINFTNAGVGPFNLSELPKEFKNGDCAIVIYSGNDLHNPSPLKVLSITAQ